MHQSLFFKVAGLSPVTLLKKRLWHWCFPVNFVKFLRSPFFIENLRWLLLFLISLGEAACASWTLACARVTADCTLDTQSSSQKHAFIYEKLNFIHHIKEKNSKANKGVGVIKKLNNILSRKALLTLYKSFVRPIWILGRQSTKQWKLF